MKKVVIFIITLTAIFTSISSISVRAAEAKLYEQVKQRQIKQSKESQRLDLLLTSKLDEALVAKSFGGSLLFR